MPWLKKKLVQIKENVLKSKKFYFKFKKMILLLEEIFSFQQSQRYNYLI